MSADALFGLASSAVDIRVIDDVALKDDALMREFYDLDRRSELHGRPHSPHWDFEEFLGAIRSPDSGERAEFFAAYDGDRMVATAILFSFLLDNTEKAWADINVDVPERRRGVGRALVEHVERLARADGRTILLTAAHLPFDDREDHGYRKFAEACGFELSNYEVTRHLALPVPDERIQEWIDERRSGPRGVHHRDLRRRRARRPGRLALPAAGPAGRRRADRRRGLRGGGGDPAAVRGDADGHRGDGPARYETVALTPDRQVVAQSTLALSLKDNTTVYQWGTFVHREHRGHRLGLATKAVNLRAVQAARDDLTLVTTQNAETNDYMVSINERIGFRPIEVHAEFVKRF